MHYSELSGKRILTMDWLEGMPLTEFITSDASQEQKDRVGQQLLDFVHYQVHTLKEFHADVHPGNFFIMPNGKLGVLDFGCVKQIPVDFYNNYFSMLKAGLADDKENLRKYMYRLDFLREDDDEHTDTLFYEVTENTVKMVAEPLTKGSFYFGDKAFFNRMANYGMEMSKKSEFRKSNAIRGPKDAIYLHRTFFGLYNILHDLNATVNMDRKFFENLEAV